MTTETRPLEGFTSISNTGTACIQFTVSDGWQVQLSGRPEDLARTYTEVRNGQLLIWQDSQGQGSPSLNLFGLNISLGSFGKNGNGYGNSLGPVDVVIHAPAQTAWENAGTGSIEVNGSYEIEHLQIVSTGTGHFRLDGLKCSGTLGLDTRGTGSILVNGQAAAVKARTTGLGNIGGQLHYATIEKTALGLGRIQL